jgi:hypothetical protein
LNPRTGEKWFRLSHLPAQDLEFFVKRYWIVEWDLSSQKPYLQENLPHSPSTWSSREAGQGPTASRPEESPLTSLKAKAGVFGMIKQARRCQNI